MPHYLGVLLLLALCCAGSAAALAFLRRHRRRRGLDESHNETAGAFMGVVGTFAAIILAFVIVLEYQALSDAEHASATEASQLLELHWAAHALPAAEGAPLQAAVLRYGDLVVGQEWPAMGAEEIDASAGWDAVTAIRLAVEAIAPANPREVSYLTAAQQATGTLVAARRSRLALSGATLSPIIWTVLAASCAATVTCGFLFRTDRLLPHVVMLTCVITVTALNLFVVYEMDYPFSHGIAVPPTEMRTAVERIRSTA